MYRNIIALYIFRQFSKYFVTNLYYLKKDICTLLSYETGSFLHVNKKYYILILFYI